MHLHIPNPDSIIQPHSYITHPPLQPYTLHNYTTIPATRRSREQPTYLHTIDTLTYPTSHHTQQYTLHTHTHTHTHTYTYKTHNTKNTFVQGVFEIFTSKLSGWQFFLHCSDCRRWLLVQIITPERTDRQRHIHNTYTHTHTHTHTYTHAHTQTLIRTSTHTTSSQFHKVDSKMMNGRLILRVSRARNLYLSLSVHLYSERDRDRGRDCERQHRTPTEGKIKNQTARAKGCKPIIHTLALVVEQTRSRVVQRVAFPADFFYFSLRGQRGSMTVGRCSPQDVPQPALALDSACAWLSIVRARTGALRLSLQSHLSSYLTHAE